MKKYRMLLIIILLVPLFTINTKATNEVSIQGEISAKPGMQIPLKLQNFEMQTDTLLLPDWRPTHVKWYLLGPSGGIVAYTKDSLDSVKKMPGGDLGKTKWCINEDSGLWKIPAFAEPGTWTLKIKLIDEGLFKTGVLHGESIHKIHTIYVSEGNIFDSLSAPLYVYWDMGLIGEIGFATPDLIIVFGIPIIFIIALLNLKAIRERIRMEEYMYGY